MHKILYVEDNFQNYRLVMRFLTLEKQQYDITQAPTGNDGLRLAKELKPDLILMDINLPDIDGVEVTRQIKAMPELKHIPVVALTANAMVGDQERFLSAGCDAYLRKPMSRADLHGVLIKYLANGHVPAPADGKPAEAKPAENKPADMRGIENRPTDIKRTDARLTAVKLDMRPADAVPVEQKPLDSKPIAAD